VLLAREAIRFRTARQSPSRPLIAASLGVRLARSIVRLSPSAFCTDAKTPRNKLASRAVFGSSYLVLTGLVLAGRVVDLAVLTGVSVAWRASCSSAAPILPRE
jgi:hypothetical protein